MRNILLFSLLILSMVSVFLSCEKDDSSFSDYDFSKYALRSQQGDDDDEDIVTLPDTIFLSIVWNGTQVTVSGDAGDSVTVAVEGSVSGHGGSSPSLLTGSDIVVTSTTQRYLQLTVSGTSDDGSLLVYSNRMWGLVMNGLTLNNADGPAINNQCGRALHVTVADGTENALSDGTLYKEVTMDGTGNGTVIDQKGTLFSEGQVYFRGTGTLSIEGNCKNAIASDDFIVIEKDGPAIDISANGTNGIKVNDGMEILGGVVNIFVFSDGGRGIKNDARMTISGGETTITTTGDCLIETTADGRADTTSCAGIKCDSLFTMTAGTLTITSTGDGGKGINCAQDIVFSGGSLEVKTFGSNDVSKPKGVKSDTGIILSGGTFSVQVQKSWACDNGYRSDDDDEQAANCVTVKGTPSTKELKKKSVIVSYE